MELFLLLLVPVVIGLAGFIFSAIKNDRRYVISLREFLTLLAVVFLVIGLGYIMAKYSSTLDQEIWNGRVALKRQEKVSCEHSYPCNPHPCGCDDKGNCSTCWDTCYEHSYDWDWALYTTNNERVRIQRIDRRGTREPPRFTKTKTGDPTALTHRFTNYIKANPWSILRREGLTEKFKELIPPYPIRIFDYHYLNRFLTPKDKMSADVARAWNQDLMELNADLGKKKEVNIIIVAVPTADSSYLHALEEAWIGGKKNDLVMIFGIPNYPKIDWVRVMSWTSAEELKVALRDKIQEVGNIEKRTEIIAIAKQRIETQFVRRKMADFEYLMAGVRPPTWALILLFILGSVVSGGLTYFFWKEDPFNTGRSRV